MAWGDIAALLNAHGPLVSALILSLAANGFLIRTILSIQDSRLQDARDQWKSESARDQFNQKIILLLENLAQDFRSKR